ncbi:pyridoxal phosphate-dependent transferase [Whalleya microplaca]|nr:pyridoxal phosphate-dependent transferase [Whalleya microplaca]
MTTTSSNTTPPKKSINLLRGWPSKRLLPADALRTASQKALSDPAIFHPGLLYGPDAGYAPLREVLAGWLARFYHSRGDEAGSIGSAGEDVTGDGAGGDDEGANRIAITGGASQSIACLLQSFTDPARTRAVWMVAPCYFLACPIFADAGFEGRLRAVPEDGEGVDLGVLEAGLRAVDEEADDDKGVVYGGGSGGVSDDGGKGKGNGGRGIGYKDPGPYRKIYRHIIYCVPSFANPSGKTMSLRRREGLVRLAREHDALVICDDVYDFLQWRTASPTSPSTPTPLTTTLLPRLADLDLALGPSPHDPPGTYFGHALSNGSFSKLVAPGTRTGWTYSTPALALGVSQTGSTRSGGAPSQLCAAILCEMLRAGDLSTHIEHTLLPAYQRRHALLLGAVQRELVPLGVKVQEASLSGRADVFGGYFVWVTLPAPGPTARAVAERCKREEKLMVGWGDMFEVHGDEKAVRFEREVRLCFAWEDEEDLVEGVERLGRVLGRMLEEGPEGWTGMDGDGDRGEDIDQMK